MKGRNVIERIQIAIIDIRLALANRKTAKLEKLIAKEREKRRTS